MSWNLQCVHRNQMILCMNLQSERLRILVVTTRMNQKYSYMWQFFFFMLIVQNLSQCMHIREFLPIMVLMLLTTYYA